MSMSRWAPLTLALVPLACGGEDEVGKPRPQPVACHPILPVNDYPDPGSKAADCNALDGYELYFLDTFEVGRSQLGWYVNSDRTAEQVPAPDEDPPRTSDILANGLASGRCVGATRSASAPTACTKLEDAPGSCNEAAPIESRRAIHVLSGSLTANGGQLGRDFPKTGCTADECSLFGKPLLPGPPEVGACSTGLGSTGPTAGCSALNDTSAWDGIVLWARVAPGSATGIRVRVGDGKTDDKSCQCDPYTNQNDSSTGCDKWGTYVALTHDFVAHFVPFKEMQQGGWGRQSDQLDTTNLFSFGIEWGRGAWDLWIDDVAFYRRRP